MASSPGAITTLPSDAEAVSELPPDAVAISELPPDAIAVQPQPGYLAPYRMDPEGRPVYSIDVPYRAAPKQPGSFGFEQPATDAIRFEQTGVRPPPPGLSEAEVLSPQQEQLKRQSLTQQRSVFDTPPTLLEHAFVNPIKDWASAFVQGGANITGLGANMAMLLDKIEGGFSAVSGQPKVEMYKQLEDWLRARQGEGQQRAAELAGGRKDFPSTVNRIAAGVVANAPPYVIGGATLGSTGGMAAIGALENADQGWLAAAKGAAEGTAVGRFYHITGPAGRLMRVPAIIAFNYALQKANHADDETALTNAFTQGLMSLPGPAKGPGLGFMAENIPKVPGMVGESVMRRLPGVRNVLTPQEQASQQFLTERDIQTPLSMQTGSKAAAGLEGTVQTLPGGGGFTEQMKAAKEKLTGQVAPGIFEQIHEEPVTREEAGTAVQQTIGKGLEQTRTGLAEEVLPGQPMTPESAGSAVLARGKQEIQALDQKADAAYRAAWEAERDPRNIREVPTGEQDEAGNPITQKMALPIDMADVQEALKPLADRYEYTLRETDIRASLGLKAMRNIINGPRYKPTSAAETDLGMLKEAARTEKGLAELRDPSQGLAAKSVAELQSAIDKKMAGAAYPGWDPASGSPNPALKNLQEGRRATARKYDIADVFRGFGKQDITELEPVGVYRGLTWEGDAGIQRLRQIEKIAPEQMPQVGRAFIEGGGKWESLGPETKKILFKDPGIIEGLDAYYAKQKKFGPLLNLEPVALFDRVTARGGKRINLLEDVAAETPEHRAKIARALVEGLFDRATREGDIQKVQSTLDSWLDLDDKSKAILVDDPAQVKNLNNLFFSMKRLMKTPNPSGSGFIVALNQMKGNIFKGLGLMGGGVLGYGHGVEGAGIGTGAGYLAGAGLEYGTNAALARLLFNQKFIRMMNRGIEMDLRGDNAGGRLAARSIAKIIDEEPPPEGPGEPPGGPGGPPPPPGGPPPPPPPPGGAAGGSEPPEWLKKGRALAEEKESLALRRLREQEGAAGGGIFGSERGSIRLAPDLNQLINERNTVYHATSPAGMQRILDSGVIGASAAKEQPGGSFEERGGVSVSRTPRLASKADKAISFEIDASRMPRNEPFVAQGYGKTIAGESGEVQHAAGFRPWGSFAPKEVIDRFTNLNRTDPDAAAQLAEPYQRMAEEHNRGLEQQTYQASNPRFEFENRTFNADVPLSAVKRVLIDRSALPEGYDIDGLKKRLADHGIPAEVKESGLQVHLARAIGSLQERLQTLGDEALDRVKNSGTFQGRTLPSLFPAEVTKDMATWGAARIANGAIEFGKWSKAMLADAADISPEAAARVRAMLPQLYKDSQKEYDHHAQTIGAQNIADLPTIMKYYQAGKQGKDWYKFVKPALHPLFGENTDLFLKMFAATSPNTKVTQNVLNAVKAYRQFLMGEPFTGMQAHVDNLNRAVAGVKMSGPKVGAFGPNLLGNLTPVTVDLWMARAILGRDTVTPLQSKLVDYMTSQAAKKVGLEPAEMQAAVWTGIKKIQKSRDTSAPPEVIVKEYLDKNPEIRKLFEDSLEMSKEQLQGLQSKQAPAKPPRT